MEEGWPDDSEEGTRHYLAGHDFWKTLIGQMLAMIDKDEQFEVR